MLIVGLTGGIGAGKSTVAAALARRGAVVIDADGVARQIVEPGGPAYQPVVDHFGPAVVAGDGRLDRAALAARVFADGDELRALNQLTHPVIERVMQERIAPYRDTDSIVVLDVPLLTAAAAAKYGCEGVIVVDTPEDVAVGRLVAHRGFTEADARARIAAQASRDERRKLATVVVDNSGDVDALEHQLDEVWTWLTAPRPQPGR